MCRSQGGWINRGRMFLLHPSAALVRPPIDESQRGETRQLGQGGDKGGLGCFRGPPLTRCERVEVTSSPACFHVK